MKKWELTKGNFDKLLALLGTDPERAGIRYQEIHRRLRGYFQAKGCSDPLKLVDLTFDRVTKKVDEGLEIEADDAYVYFRGVAHKILLEYLRGPNLILTEDVSTGWPPPPNPDTTQRQIEQHKLEEQQAQCLEQCLENLSSEKRDVIIKFLTGEKREKINRRREMAKQLGISSNALTIRVFKIKGELESCCQECLKVMARDQEA
jgi:DNA-directed RNA polymerase specialized sigma24 family protein